MPAEEGLGDVALLQFLETTGRGGVGSLPSRDLVATTIAKWVLNAQGDRIKAELHRMKVENSS